MALEKGCRKEKNQNIQVFVRLRPLNQREKDIKSLGVVEVVNNREVVVRQSQQVTFSKKFTFDRAFGPYAKQVEVYQEVVSPLIEEVLAGYNCTVFAYGQTGTGKTHTMVGEKTGDETTWQNDPLAGIIPRALSQLFDELRLSNTEYTVRVSYLELYNEELFDLLSTSEDNSKLRIYEDITRKGSNIVNGLEEITVYNKNEVYKIMAQGQERKKVASTLMNAQSSRSHTVFTIVVHMKENSPEGEEFVKIGKLNLVDLAGSENISKAGSDNPAKKERARECVNINQSLLTLGRVITALVERHPHIPYRESKLTRILQESLGGRTKTSIIATISPGHKDLEETLSTLEYAHRAKNIQNKPEVNQKMTKKAILKEYAEEIDRLKRDLQAARDKNGVYLANETFAEITLKQEEQRKEIQELLLKKRAMEEERDRMESVFNELNQKIKEQDSELNDTKNKLNLTKERLANTANVLRLTKVQYEEQKYIAQEQQQTEEQLSSQARQLLNTADTATTHLTHLHDSVDKHRNVESTNLEVTKTYRELSSQHRERIESGVHEFASKLAHALAGLHAARDAHESNSTECQEENKRRMEELVQKMIEAMNEIKLLTDATQKQICEATEGHGARLRDTVFEHSNIVQQTMEKFVRAVSECVEYARSIDVKGNVADFVQQWYSSASARVNSIRAAQAQFGERSRALTHRRAAAASAQRDARRARALHLETQLNHYLTEIEQEKASFEERLSEKLKDIEIERRETEARLNDWMEQQRRLLEERVASEKNALEDRLSRKIEMIEEEKRLFEERIQLHVQRQQMQLEAHREEIERADSDLKENERQEEECIKHIQNYEVEFDSELSAMNMNMESFSKNVVTIVEKMTNEMLTALHQAQDNIEKEACKVIETDKQTAKVFAENTNLVLSNVVRDSRCAIDSTLHKIEENNTATVMTLNELAAATSSLMASNKAHRDYEVSVLEAVQHQIQEMEGGLKQEVARYASLDEKYLTTEYRIYSPTGKTPVRQQYRYPRELVATSPLDRVLARYRAMRQKLHDEDVVVVESDNESRRPSDSESSLSEDSAVADAFVAPSPPCDAPKFNPKHTPKHTFRSPNMIGGNQQNFIVKSTSDTDIYAYSKQGKENTDRDRYKKPSKLPAPTSHKKPLVQRNTTVN